MIVFAMLQMTLASKVNAKVPVNMSSTQPPLSSDTFVTAAQAVSGAKTSRRTANYTYESILAEYYTPVAPPASASIPSLMNGADDVSMRFSNRGSTRYEHTAPQYTRPTALTTP